MSPPDRSAARAIDALRRGWPVAITAAEGRIVVLAIEGADDMRLAAFDPARRSSVLLSAGRAATLHLTNQRPAAIAEGEAVGAAVRIARVPWLDLPAAVALADPALDLAHPLSGPWRTEPVSAPLAAAAALRLARLAGLLPAFFQCDDAEAEVETTAEAIVAHDAPARLAITSRARLPIAAADRCEIVAFRNPDDAAEHVALLIGTPSGAAPLVRLHSECLTGDALGSLKCDCGPQLDGALGAIAASGWGILLYLRQEGRGIGLVNKLRAYALQDQGFDTVDANVRLGFAIDERDFGVAAAMLRLLGQERVRLLTNNPAKVAGLEAAGVTVIERVVHAMTANPHNHAYLTTKRDRTGHML